VSIGTIEPRKNLRAAADICAALAARLGRTVEHHIIGREGWGDDARILRQRPNTVLHGALDDTQIRPIVEDADLLLSTSHDEGLGLPLLETQYAGIPIVAPDAAIFREVAGPSAILIEPHSPERAAERIAAALSDDSWRAAYAARSTANVARWNETAERDRRAVVELLSGLCRTEVH
jgi:glycosyltransferase involved in cell wall biosynthesis